MSITSIIQSSFSLWRFGVIFKPKTTLKRKEKKKTEEALGLVKILEASHNNKIIQTKNNNNKKKKKERANTYRNYWKFICDCFSCTMTRIWMWCHFLCLARPEKWWNWQWAAATVAAAAANSLRFFLFGRFRPQSSDFSGYRFSSSLFLLNECCTLSFCRLQKNCISCHFRSSAAYKLLWNRSTP